MKDLNHIKEVAWYKDNPLNTLGIRAGLVTMPNGVQVKVVAGNNEGGWEHVSVEVMARRLPTWGEMCFIKDLFWDLEEEVIQIHPKLSEYVNLAEALHLWRPINGDWSIMNGKGGKLLDGCGF